MGLTEHESNKFAYRCEHHEHVTGSLRLIAESNLIVTLSQRLSHPGSNFILICNLLIVVLATNIMNGHSQ